VYHSIIMANKRYENEYVPLPATEKNEKRPLSDNIQLSREELLSRLQEYRATNFQLLEEKRQWILRSQNMCDIEAQLDRSKHEISKLRQQLHDALEKRHEGVQHPKVVSRQTSCASRKSNQSTDENPVDISGLDVDEVTSEDMESTRRRETSDPSLVEADSTVGRDVTCTCGALKNIDQLMMINHQWQKDYTALQEDYNSLKGALWKAESRIATVQSEKEELIVKLKCLNNDRSLPSMTSRTSTEEDIEALKQQLIVYKEDFDAEKKDTDRLTSDNNKLKIELQKSYDIIDDLTTKSTTIKANLRRVSNEKDHIISELRKLTSPSHLPFSPVGEAPMRIGGAANQCQRDGDTTFNRTHYGNRDDEHLKRRMSQTRPQHAGEFIHHSQWDARGLPSSFYGGAAVRDQGVSTNSNEKESCSSTHNTPVSSSI